jgi:hypothetical protein
LPWKALCHLIDTTTSIVMSMENIYRMGCSSVRIETINHIVNIGVCR